eukprot:scaffold645_cov247-Pinguiococcus_pyrenoidosus.AAC.9
MTLSPRWCAAGGLGKGSYGTFCALRVALAGESYCRVEGRAHSHTVYKGSHQGSRVRQPTCVERSLLKEKGPVLQAARG